jgi:diguanylate cyclase (GGDEF)-like protein/PAS domain S-box-containing protein
MSAQVSPDETLPLGQRVKNDPKINSAYRIRTLLLFLLAFHMFALVAALTFMTYRQYQDEVAEQVNLANAARLFSVNETEEFIEHAETLLIKLAKLPVIKALDTNQCDRLFSELQYLPLLYANLFTLDQDGKLVCSAKYVTQNTATGPDPKYFFSEIQRTQQFTIGKPAIGFITGEWVTTIAYPIKDAQGQFRGVVGLAIDLFRFKPFIPLKGVPVGTYSGIINNEGVMVSVSEGSETLIGKRIIDETLEQSSKVREGTFRMTDHKGSKRLVSFGPVKDSEWSLFVSLDEDSILDPIVQKVWRRIGFIVVIMSILGMMTHWVARRIAKPFESVSDTVVRVGSGDTCARAEPTGPLEARQIAIQLNNMLDARELVHLKLKQSEERFRTAFLTTPDALAISRLDDGLFLEVNDGFIPQSGWSREEIIGKTSIELNIWRWPDERQKFATALREHGECSNLEAEFKTKDGRIWMGIVSARVITLDGTACVMSITHDITEIKKTQELIHNLSYSDMLTGLPNRRLFIDRLEQAIASNTRHQTVGALILVNMDDFKSINDALGHDEGNLLLQEVAKRLQASSRLGETVARLGGDEFLILLPDLEFTDQSAHAEALLRCQQIQLELKKPYRLSHNTHHRSASISVTLTGRAGVGAYEAMQQVEVAMHHAKADGRNKLCFFEPNMLIAIDAKLSLEERLRTAIDQKQLVLYFQAQVTAVGYVVGAEALVRWHDPEGGVVSPADFIPLAEESGLILPLGLWVLETACQQIAQWELQPEMSHLYVAVNVSAHQFLHDGFVEDVRATLERNLIKPGRLKLELTESILISNPANAIANMGALKDLGVSFSLDDFGTGYSSLAYLKRLPLNQLKIDQGFVRDILTSTSDAGIIKMIIALAVSMNLNVVAEGVETEQQCKLLVDLGCNLYQGYLFSHPVIAEEFERYVYAKNHS